MNSPFRCGEALKFLLERFDHRCSREQAAMGRKRGVPHQHAFVLERRYPVADGLRWRSRPNRRANLLQSAARWFRDACKVLVCGFRSAFAFRSGTALARFCFFHARNRTKASNLASMPQPTVRPFDTKNAVPRDQTAYSIPVLPKGGVGPPRR